MALNEYIDTNDLNRAGRNIADTGIKIFFKQLGAVLGFLINFIKEMVRSILGK